MFVNSVQYVILEFAFICCVNVVDVICLRTSSQTLKRKLKVFYQLRTQWLVYSIFSNTDFHIQKIMSFQLKTGKNKRFQEKRKKKSILLFAWLSLCEWL